MRWWMIVIIFIPIAVTLWAGEQESKTDQVCKTVDPATFMEEYTKRGGLLLDVRTPGEFAEGYLAGAKNIDYYKDGFAEEMKAMPKDQAVFVYCRSGGRSARTMKMLEEAGFKVVFDMAGGVIRWQKEGRKLEKPATP